LSDNQQRENATRAFLAVEQCLTPAQQDAILATALQTNPTLGGIRVADWLDLVDNTDIYATIGDAIWDGGGRDVVQHAGHPRHVSYPLYTAAAAAVCTLHAGKGKPGALLQEILALARRAAPGQGRQAGP
jgi:hypothetical protein